MQTYDHAMSRRISEELAKALHALVEATEAVEASPSDSQAARRAIERASVVSQLARREGFGAKSAS
jgi:hypothetical protein